MEEVSTNVGNAAMVTRQSKPCLLLISRARLFTADRSRKSPLFFETGLDWSRPWDGIGLVGNDREVVNPKIDTDGFALSHRRLLQWHPDEQ